MITNGLSLASEEISKKKNSNPEYLTIENLIKYIKKEKTANKKDIMSVSYSNGMQCGYQVVIDTLLNEALNYFRVTSEDMFDFDKDGSKADTLLLLSKKFGRTSYFYAHPDDFGSRASSFDQGMSTAFGRTHLLLSEAAHDIRGDLDNKKPIKENLKC